ncbi:FcoT family thioesterase [Wenjunlia tyrosinilytica]|uniref:(2E)-enoyl-[ACP] glycyltransferase n=1 Tax=Wenjunlia tyrosinilytica TaxID=1544741 RepID=A0A917ZVB3_9ACTN|nr:FcoT family thioesterase [Wenjunlia tyrosinilytica]GGO95883.1 hypothetical protein GCM10012280_54110 [Wenjunlia tyrosinilytica]
MVDDDLDAVLLTRALEPYHPHCRYLRTAALRTAALADPQRAGSAVAARGEFTVPESCCVRGSGHFGALEFAICLDQLMHFTLARAVHGRLIEPFGRWTTDDYWQRQLSDVAVVELRSRFRRGVCPSSFHGELEIRDRGRREDPSGSLIALEISCRFWDDDGGNCSGDLRVALTDLPPAR